MANPEGGEMNWKTTLALLAVGAIIFRFPWLLIVGLFVSPFAAIFVGMSLDNMPLDHPIKMAVGEYTKRKSEQFAGWLNRVLNGGSK
jgi:hypothetical protein